MCLFWAHHPCPEPSGMSAHAAWLIRLSSGLGLPAVRRGDLGRAWERRRRWWQWIATREKVGSLGFKVFIIGFSMWFLLFCFP